MSSKNSRFRKPIREHVPGLAVGNEAMKLGRETLQEVLKEAMRGQQHPYFADTVKEMPNGNLNIIPKQVTLTFPDGKPMELVIYRWKNRMKIETLAEFNAYMDACESGVHIDHQ